MMLACMIAIAEIALVNLVHWPFFKEVDWPVIDSCIAITLHRLV